jgi:hypothetical protein
VDLPDKLLYKIPESFDISKIGKINLAEAISVAEETFHPLAENHFENDFKNDLIKEINDVELPSLDTPSDAHLDVDAPYLDVSSNFNTKDNSFDTTRSNVSKEKNEDANEDITTNDEFDDEYDDNNDNEYIEDISDDFQNPSTDLAIKEIKEDEKNEEVEKVETMPENALIGQIEQAEQIKQVDKLEEPEILKSAPVSESINVLEDITDRIVILEDDTDVDRFVNQIQYSKQADLKRLLKYLDGLFEKLPEDVVKNFAESEYFDIYVNVLNEMGI